MLSILKLQKYQVCPLIYNFLAPLRRQFVEEKNFVIRPASEQARDTDKHSETTKLFNILTL